MSRVPDIDDFLDPNSLTPRDFYSMQSETWAQGAEYEKERIIKLLEERLGYGNEDWYATIRSVIDLIRG